MSVFKEIRTRWMYWRYRNITRNRQRVQAKWAVRRAPRPLYPGDSYRGSRPMFGTGANRTAKTWMLLILTVIAIAVVQHYFSSTDLVFVADIAILAAAYFIWLQVTV